MDEEDFDDYNWWRIWWYRIWKEYPIIDETSSWKKYGLALPLFVIAFINYLFCNMGSWRMHIATI
jgi:hypothetical protein